MSRLMSLLTLLLLLVVAVQPASGVVRVSPENRAPGFFAEEETRVWGMPSSNQDSTREAAGYGYEFASDVCEGPNLYGYVGNGPTGEIDPLGLLGGGLYLGAQGTAGNLMASLHAEGAVGAGYFSKGGVGGFVSHGESAGPGGIWSPQHDPKDDMQLNPAIGAAASIGVGAFLTSAEYVEDLEKTKYNLNFTIGFGPAKIGFDIGFGGGGPWFVGISPPFAGESVGLSASLQHVQTKTKGQHAKPCP